MYEGAKLITSGRPQALGSGLCDFAQVVSSVRSWIMVVCALVLEHLERFRLQAYMWKRENCPLNYDVNNYVYNISVNFDQIHATLLSIMYLVLASDACLWLDQIPSPNVVSD